MKLDVSFLAPAVGILLIAGFAPTQSGPISEDKYTICFSDSIAPDPCNGYVIEMYEDTLFYTPESYMAYVPDPNCLVQKLPFGNGSVGVIVAFHYDDFIATYRCDSIGHWQREFCGKGEGGEDFAVTMPDLNFDGHPDLLIDGDYGGLYGNHFAHSFLFNPTSQIFQRYPDLDLENLILDVHNRQIRSLHYGSLYGACIKQIYAWEHDSIVLLEEAIYHAEVDSASITFQHRASNGTMRDEFLEGKMEPLWQFFVDYALWAGF